jgi:pimeloyl-ACP methyl ester carboxylesterase
LGFGRFIGFLTIVGLAVPMGIARGQVGSPTGQASSLGQKPGAPPGAQAPKLTTSKPTQVPAGHLPVAVTTEIGDLHGVSFRIDVPQQSWNRGLVVYFHGYEGKPRIFSQQDSQPGPPSRILQQILNRGYAVAQSGYSAGGWAVAAAFQESEELRRYFVKKYGKPRETLAMGHSMGGLLTVMTLEKQPEAYAGGLALCGVLAPTDLVMQRAFANRVAFDAFFPGVLPEVDRIPPSFAMNDAPAIANVQKALDSKPDSAALIRSLADIHTNRGLADVLVFNSFVIEDLRLKTGGNPFDNRNLIYTGTTDDYTLNTQVKRYAADPKAVQYISGYYTPTGELKRKLLAIHTTYDPLVPASTVAYYDEATRRFGAGDLFVQKYVNRDGHCNITPEQTGEVFDELAAWVHENLRPRPGLLAEEAPVQKSPAQPQPKAPPKNVGKPQ